MTAVIMSPPPPTVETAVGAADDSCPRCGSLDVAGMQIQGVYDGVLYWICETCMWAWPRTIHGGWRLEQSIRHAAEWRERHGH